MTTYKSVKYNISGADLTGIPTSAITSGTFADARISESSVTAHVTATDLQPIKSDISALALREATNESSAAFNLPNQFIDTFATDTLGTKTDVVITSGNVSSTTSTTASSVIKFDGGSTSNGGLYVSQTGLLATNNTNYTQEAWGYLNTSSTNNENHMFSNYGDPYGILYAGSATTKQLRRGLGNGSWQSIGNLGATDLVTLETWYHFAYTKTASGVSFYFNGNRMEENNTAAFTEPNGSAYLGQGVGANTWNWEGYITEWRVSDVARYTGATYTIPTSGFTNDGNTKLLVHSNTTNGSSTFTDSSSNAYTVVQGNANIVHSTAVTSPISSSTTSATGTAIQAANAVGSAKTKVGGTMLYKDNAGTATLGTDLKIYFTCNGGSNWTEATSYSAITPVYSTGIKQVRLGETTCTSGTDVRYKAVWANQASGSKETQLHGIGVNY